jgi:hypothetical protein
VLRLGVAIVASWGCKEAIGLIAGSEALFCKNRRQPSKLILTDDVFWESCEKVCGGALTYFLSFFIFGIIEFAFF